VIFFFHFIFFLGCTENLIYLVATVDAGAAAPTRLGFGAVPSRKPFL
jgi:hypothetical protein